MKKLIFEDTTVIKKPYVEIDGVEHEVQDGEFEGGTDLNAQNFNQVQDNIESYIDGESSMGRIIVEDIECKNLFSSSNLTNATIDASGGYTTENRRLVSDYINIKNSNQLTLSFNTFLPFLGLAFYDDDKNFISRTIANDVQKLTSDTPNNAIYVRGFFQSNSETEKLAEASLLKYQVQLEKGATNTSFIEHKEFSNKQVYSLNEVEIGTWLGVKLYRKVINIGTIPNNTTKSINSGLTNESIVNISGIAKNNTGYCLFLPYVNPTSQTGIRVNYNETSHTIEIITTSDMSAYSGYVVIEYIKTKTNTVVEQTTKTTTSSTTNENLEMTDI